MKSRTRFKYELYFMECDKSLITVDRYFLDTGASDITTFTYKNATFSKTLFIQKLFIRFY